MDTAACHACHHTDNEDVAALIALVAKRRRISASRGLRDERGRTAARVLISIVTQAKPSPYERIYIWRKKGPPAIDGVFVRRFVVEKHLRRKGHGTRLMNEVKALADRLVKRVYIDTTADNGAMRAFVRKLGARENMFWHTPRGTLMVRYIWI